VRAVLALFFWAIAAILFLPLAVMAAMSMQGSPLVRFPIQGATLRWYGLVFDDPELLAAILYSAAIAAASAMLAVVIGTVVAVAAQGLARPVARLALLSGACIPLVTPGMVSAIALRMFIRVVGIDPGALAVVLGHAAHAVPYVAIMVSLRLASLPAALGDAARDLGAGEAAVFRRIVLPLLRPTLAGAALLAALQSFDDFIRSFFLGGLRPTLPVLLYGRLRSGLTPEIDAVATLLLVITMAVGIAVTLARQRSGQLSR
jgi:spermidine/putrescine transport system permease protein